VDPTFLDIEQIIELHLSMIERYGGSEGLRDLGLIQSAIAMPQASFGGEYLHKDIFEMAAAYLFHIVQNHPFLDGNKRTGAAGVVLAVDVNDHQARRGDADVGVRMLFPPRFDPIRVSGDVLESALGKRSLAAGHAGKDRVSEFGVTERGVRKGWCRHRRPPIRPRLRAVPLRHPIPVPGRTASRRGRSPRCGRTSRPRPSGP